MEPIQMIRATNGKFFHVTFRKKNGEVRHMTARLGVSKHVNGIGLAYSPADYGLMTVWDTTKKQYRMINTAAILAFQCGSVTWKAAA